MDFLIEMSGITKVFPGVTANDNVTLNLKKGEIHALLGENGAGKTTLVNILFGLYKCDKGIIKKNGKKVRITNPGAAKKLGIGMVHQHFRLVKNFTVLENIILGAEPVKHGMLKMDSARKQVMELQKHYKLEINPDYVVSDITVGMQQRAEILKMLYRENEILIFDEPTAMLTPAEAKELMRILKKLAAEGKAILFITHKLDEIKLIADRCTVLRKGKNEGTVDVNSVSAEELSKMMIGGMVNPVIKKKENQHTDIILKVENLTVNGSNKEGAALNKVNNVSLEVYKGEIVCIAGIDGNGQQELISAITGIKKPERGYIYLDKINITNKNVRSRGIAFIPEDRHKHALVMDHSLSNNLILKKYYYPDFQKNGLLKFKEIKKYADLLIKDYDIRCGQGGDTIVRNMSGGNQQKAVIAREISCDSPLLVAVQPTRGLDAGACIYIRNKLIEQRDKGKGILLVSMELDEVMEISDRILVMHKGKITANVKANEVDLSQLGLYMAGSLIQEAV